MKISKFQFTVEPFVYAGTRGGEEKTLTIRVETDGDIQTIQKVMPNQQPFENELELYARLAIEALKANM